jgi:hypothetical protein
MKTSHVQKYLNFKFMAYGDIGWHIVSSNILRSFSIDNMSNF